MVLKTTRITIETESLLVVHKGRTFDWLAAGKLHLWSTEGGQALICLASLLRCFESDSARALPNATLNCPKTGEKK
jgi:hypothetical protein